MKTGWSRRSFLKTTAAAVLLGTVEKSSAANSSLPRRRLDCRIPLRYASQLAASAMLPACMTRKGARSARVARVVSPEPLPEVASPPDLEAVLIALPEHVDDGHRQPTRCGADRSERCCRPPARRPPP